MNKLLTKANRFFIYYEVISKTEKKPQYRVNIVISKI